MDQREMRNFPLFLNTKNETIVIIGGGETAAQKSRLLARTEARLIIMAKDLTEELSALVQSGRAEHVARDLALEDLNARLVVVATECAGFDAAAADLARQAGALVNVVDRPHLCDVNMPAIVDRDPVVIAIGTEGTAPVLARRIKSAIETMLEPGLGQLASLAGRLRPKVAHRIAPRDRRAFWDWFFGAMRRQVRQTGLQQTEREVDEVLALGQVPKQRSGGVVTLIEIPARAPDLISLRAVARLQTADHLAVEPNLPFETLELARRDAERSVLSTASLAGAVETTKAGGTFVALSTSDAELAALHHGLVQRGCAVEMLRPTLSEPAAFKLAS
ncbi:MAG: bifunctional precorrin-2 dehydrogenase/sirohydrochlorin ferrochelatase [Pseudomonadota bacterium]